MPSKAVQTKLYFFSCNGVATKFVAPLSLSNATVAAEEYSADRGYPCEPFLCEACTHYHVRQSEVPREIPEEDRWLPSRHRALRARVREVQAARRAKEERAFALKEELEALRMLRSANKTARRLERKAAVVKVKRA